MCQLFHSKNSIFPSPKPPFSTMSILTAFILMMMISHHSYHIHIVKSNGNPPRLPISHPSSFSEYANEVCWVGGLSEPFKSTSHDTHLQTATSAVLILAALNPPRSIFNRLPRGGFFLKKKS